MFKTNYDDEIVTVFNPKNPSLLFVIGFSKLLKKLSFFFGSDNLDIIYVVFIGGLILLMQIAIFRGLNLFSNVSFALSSVFPNAFLN